MTINATPDHGPAAAFSVAYIADRPRVSSTTGAQSVLFTVPGSGDTVVRSVTLAAPAAGTVMVTATGYFNFSGGGYRGQRLITTGNTVDSPSRTEESEAHQEAHMSRAYKSDDEGIDQVDRDDESKMQETNP